MPKRYKNHCLTCGKYYESAARLFCSIGCYRQDRKSNPSEYAMTEDGRRRVSIANSGAKNGMWRGNKVSYSAIHDWVKWHLPKSEVCNECKKVPPLDLANISNKYKRDLSDWEWLCRRCHMIKDGRLERLHSQEVRRKGNETRKRRNALSALSQA